MIYHNIKLVINHVTETDLSPRPNIYIHTRGFYTDENFNHKRFRNNYKSGSLNALLHYNNMLQMKNNIKNSTMALFLLKVGDMTYSISVIVQRSDKSHFFK